MSGWFNRIAKDQSEETVRACLAFFENEYRDGIADLDCTDKRIWEVSRVIPGLSSFRYGQWRELFHIAAFLKERADQAKTLVVEFNATHYKRAVSDRQAEKIAETDPEVCKMRELQYAVELMADKFAGLSKGLEALHFQVSNLTKLRTAGMEDAII